MESQLKVFGMLFDLVIALIWTSLGCDSCFPFAISGMEYPKTDRNSASSFEFRRAKWTARQREQPRQDTYSTVSAYVGLWLDGEHRGKEHLRGGFVTGRIARARMGNW